MEQAFAETRRPLLENPVLVSGPDGNLRVLIPSKAGLVVSLTGAPMAPAVGSKAR